MNDEERELDRLPKISAWLLIIAAMGATWAWVFG